MAATEGILIVGHGTRDQRGQDEFAQLVQCVEALAPSTIVQGCFLEMVEPDLAAGMANIYQRGARNVTIVPLMLVAAGHTLRDIPAQVAAAGSDFAELRVTLAPHLGCRDSLLELAARRFREALASNLMEPARVSGRPAAGEPPECGEQELRESLLLVVGRGTREPSANDELRDFADRLAQRVGVAWCETCFLAMAEPTLPDALASIAARDARRVIVQPHFLFAGELLQRAGQIVGRFALGQPMKQWALARHLGPDPLLAQAVLDAVRQGAARPGIPATSRASGFESS